MAGKAGHSGGTRVNAGRKPASPIFAYRGERNGYEIWQGRKFLTLRSWSLRQGERTNVEQRIGVGNIPTHLAGDMNEAIINPYDSDYKAPRGIVLANYISLHGECFRKGYEV